MEKIKIIIIDGVVEDVFSTNPNVEVEIVNTSWHHRQDVVEEAKNSMHEVY